MTVMVWAMFVAACATFPHSFTPQTPDQQAVARTLETFLTALRAHDFATVRTVIVPEATITADIQGSQVSQERILALQQSASNTPLLNVTPNRLVDYRQLSADQASLGAYLHDFLGPEIQTIHFTWTLRRQDGQWRIHHITQTTWSTPQLYRAGGA
jgi:hypothetical protein